MDAAVEEVALSRQVTVAQATARAPRQNRTLYRAITPGEGMVGFSLSSFGGRLGEEMTCEVESC